MGNNALALNIVTFMVNRKLGSFMVSARTIATEIGFCLGVLNHEDFSTSPNIIEMESSHWEQFVNSQNRYNNLVNLSFRQGQEVARNIGLIESVEWVANSHLRYGSQIDVVINGNLPISLKHDSAILYNPGPDLLFARNLNDNLAKTNSLWKQRVAPNEYQDFYYQARHTTRLLELPQNVSNITSEQGLRLRRAMPARQWPSDYVLLPYYQSLTTAVAIESSRIWSMNNSNEQQRTNLFLRIFRFLDNQNYRFVGRCGEEFLLNVISSSEWRRRYRVINFRSFRRPSVQAEVGWEFTILDISNGEEITISGHVQVRWSHGKNFYNNCESKVYLDSNHSEIPGYDSI